MSATPILPYLSRASSPRRPLHHVWIPVLFGLSVICAESTTIMGAGTTGRWLSDIWPRILGQVNSPVFGDVHIVLRKLGHFTGYGTLGLLLRKAWHRSVRLYMGLSGTQLRVAASALAVAFTFLVGCLDEWHQSTLPGRTSTRHDVIIDTAGALLFNIIFWVVRSRKSSSLAV